MVTTTNGLHRQDAQPRCARRRPNCERNRPLTCTNARTRSVAKLEHRVAQLGRSGCRTRQRPSNTRSRPAGALRSQARMSRRAQQGPGTHAPLGAHRRASQRLRLWPEPPVHRGSDHIPSRCTCSPCTEPVGLGREPAYRSRDQPAGRPVRLQPRTGASVVDSMDRVPRAAEASRAARSAIERSSAMSPSSPEPAGFSGRRARLTQSALGTRGRPASAEFVKDLGVREGSSRREVGLGLADRLHESQIAENLVRLLQRGCLPVRWGLHSVEGTPGWTGWIGAGRSWEGLDTVLASNA